MLVDTRRRSATRMVWTLVLGFFVGGIFTALSENFLPESAARTFLTTSVRSSIGPFSMNLVALDFTLGPVGIQLNFLTLVGVFIVALVARSWI